MRKLIIAAFIFVSIMSSCCFFKKHAWQPLPFPCPEGKEWRAEQKRKREAKKAEKEERKLEIQQSHES